MKRQISIIVIAVALATLSSFKSLNSFKGNTVEFYSGSYDNLLREARKQKKPIILDFWAAWCAPCVKLDKETFTDKSVANYINDNFLVYKVDIDTFDGMEIVDRYSVEVFPTLIVLDHKADKVASLKGFFPPAYFQKEIEKIKENQLPNYHSNKDSFVFNH